MNATNAPQTPGNLQAEQKAHEPSMEDILASIRRIIADDDALPLSRRAASVNLSPAAAAPPPVSAPPPASPAAAPAARVEPAGPALRSPPLQAQVAPPAPAQNPPPLPTPLPPGNLFAPRVAPPPMPAAPALDLRPAFNEAQDTAQHNWAAAPFEPEPRAAPNPQVRFDDAGLQAAQLAFRASFAAPPPVPIAEAIAAPPVAMPQAQAPQVSQPVEEPAPEPVRAPQVFAPQAQAPQAQAPLAQAPQVFAPQAFAPQTPAPQVFAPQAVEPAVAPVRPVADEPQAPPQRSIGIPPARFDRPEPSLLSELNGVKVGAAFEALAESALLRDPDMVERLTREILHPIIKSWLDDNLPNVVERLVRAEIERVARGPKG